MQFHVNANVETIVLWLMIAFNLLFLIGRFYLRLRPRSPARNRHDDIDSPEPEASAKPRQEPPKSRLKPSDYLLVLAFVAIFFQALLLTKANVVETLIRDKNPSVPMYMDPVVFYRLSEQDQVVYTNNYIQVLRIPFSTRLKHLLVILYLNILALWTVKASLLMFLYEIFPKHLRTPLHLSAFYLAATFVASAIETGLWCHPISDIWTPSTTRHLSTGGYCTLKISSAYNAIQFSMHMSSMLILILLPVMLLFRAPSRLRGELGFALSILGFGIVSVIASVVAFAMLLRMGNNQTSPTARHMTVLSSVIDQNAIFCGVCLNVVRVWRRGMDMAAVEDHGLVIKVEQRWSVHVDIVERWGYGWKDPWEQGGDSGGLDTQVDPSERLGSAE